MKVISWLNNLKNVFLSNKKEDDPNSVTIDKEVYEKLCADNVVLLTVKHEVMDTTTHGPGKLKVIKSILNIPINQKKTG